MTATNVVNPALASADQMIIGSVMGVTSVAHYAVPMNLVLRSGFIPWAFGRTFFPRVSSLSGAAAYALSARALASMAYGFAAICAPAIILSPTFFRYWIGPDFAVISAPVAQILFPGMWMSGLSLVGFTLLQSQGRADLTGKLSMLEFLPFLESLGFDPDFRDCWRGCRLDVEVHSGRAGDILGFRNEKKRASSFGAPGRAFGSHAGGSSLPGAEYILNLAVAALATGVFDRPQLSILRQVLALVHAHACEPSACFCRRSVQTAKSSVPINTNAQE